MEENEREKISGADFTSSMKIIVSRQNNIIKILEEILWEMKKKNQK